jgi:hypothetical protein
MKMLMLFEIINGDELVEIVVDLLNEDELLRAISVHIVLQVFQQL